MYIENSIRYAYFTEYTFMSAVKYIITLTHGNFHGVIKLNMLPKVNLLDFNFGGFLLSKFSVIKYMKPYLKIKIDLYFSADELHIFI